MLDNYNDILTISDITRILKMGRTKVYSLLRKGMIRGTKVTGKWLVRKCDLLSYLGINNNDEKEMI
jgi:excisionase family DNA binding protein